MNALKPKKKVLVVTPCPKKGLPTQGFKISERLREAGFRVSVLSRAQSSLLRALDIIFRGLMLIPFHSVVFVNLYGGRAFVYESLIILYSYLWRKRCIILIHSGLMPIFVQRWPRWSHFVFSYSSLVLTPSEFLKKKLCQLGIQVDGVIPNFIDLEDYSFKERAKLEPKFIYVRGFWSVYNPEMALKAFAIVQGLYPNASLTMAGREGDSSGKCRSLARDLALKNIQFVGLVEKKELISLAACHDIHLHTNKSDNMPVSIIEMWACGLPIVGTNVGGMPYLVRNNEDAILVESDDFQAMARACIHLLSQPDIALRLSRNGRARAVELTWSKVKPSWLKALWEVSSHDDPRSPG